MAACAYCRRPAGAQAPTCSCPATTARDEDLRQLLGEALRDGAALHTAAMHRREIDQQNERAAWRLREAITRHRRDTVEVLGRTPGPHDETLWRAIDQAKLPRAFPHPAT